MNYIKIDSCDFNNGTGARVTIWVAGCDLKCVGCHNYESWDFNSGKEFGEEELLLVKKMLSDNHIRGLSILGGEPLHQKNRDVVFGICDYVRDNFPKKDIWIWTGYDSKTLPVIPNCDVLIDGRFDSSRPTIKKFRGSDNQHMFRVLKDRELVLVD
ncbi:MAG: anaerobic ribonucleoside-triphosphate reductase activating protein [Cetobacterium sp.]